MATIQVRALWDSIDTQQADYSVATVATFPVGVFNVNSLNETQLQDLADALAPYLSVAPSLKFNNARNSQYLSLTV